MNKTAWLISMFLVAPAFAVSDVEKICNGDGRVSGPCTLQLIASHSNKCLEVIMGSKDDFASLVQTACKGRPSQFFQLVKQDDGTHALLNANSGKCIEAPDANKDANTPLTQWTCHFFDHQRYQIVQLAGGGFSLKMKHSGNCVSVLQGNIAELVSVIQSPCDGTDNQRFTLMVGRP